MAGGGGEESSCQPCTIAKVPILRRLDLLSQDQAQCQSFLTDLKSDAGKRSSPAEAAQLQVDILSKYNILRTDVERQHMLDHWFGGWWPNQQPIVYILRDGLILAFQEAVDNQLPVDSYWIMCDDACFETVVCVSGAQVTRLIITPTVPEQLAYRFLTQDQPIKVVRRGKMTEQEIDRKADTGVVTVQLKTYPYT